MHKSYVLTSSNNWLLIVDIEVLLISFFLSYRFASRFTNLLKIHEYMWILIVIIPMWVILMSRSRMYTNITFYTYDRILANIFLYSVISNVFVAAMLYFVKDYMFSRFLYIVFSLSSFCFIVLEWYLCKLYIAKETCNTKNMPRVIIIGTPRIALKFKHFLKDAKIRVNFLGYVQLEGTRRIKPQIKLGDVKDLESIIVKNIVDEVIFAIPRDYVGEVEKHVLLCERMGITVRMILDLYDLKIARTHLSKLGPMPMLTYHTVSLSDLQLFTKRVMDVAGALFGIILASIPSLIIAAAIKLESPGPVIFAQDRVGLNGRIFKFYKFRSMYIDAEERKKELMARNQVGDGMMFKIKDDPRITKIGKFIRKTSLDELPQFINVLKGDMSLIGTRPPTIDEVVKYKDYHRRRISIKPGITGLWQISGRSNIVNFDEVVSLDTKYIDKWSIWLDIKVIIKTILTLISRKGAY